MKKLLIVLAILLISSTCSAAWVTVVDEQNFTFSVKEESIQHYTSKAGTPATSGVYNWYNRQSNTEISYVVQINDSTYEYLNLSYCTWVNKVKQSCSNVPKLFRTIRGSNAEVIMEFMVNYRPQATGKDSI